MKPLRHLVTFALPFVIAGCDRAPRMVVTADARTPMPVDTPPAVHLSKSATKARTDSADTPDTARKSALDELAAALEVPVRGVTRDQLRDSYAEARGTRVHHAMDILAPRGTEVVAAVDGRLLKKFSSKAGGLMVYATDSTEQYIMLYGHLDSYAADLSEGMKLTRGQVIGYVGTTGNAPSNTPHLHFGILRGNPAKSWSKGTAINPFRLYVPRTGK